MDRRSYIFSACLHVAVVLILIVGIPWFSTSDLSERVISVDIVADSSLMPSPPPPSQKTEVPKPPKPETKPEVKEAKPEPAPKPEPQPEPKQEKPVEQTEKPKEEQAPSLADEQTKEVIQNKPTETSKPQPKSEEKAEVTPVPKPLRQPKAPAPPAEPKPAQEQKHQQEFDKLLSSLDEKEPASSPNKLAEDQMGNTLDPSERAALVDALRRQIEQHWNKPVSIAGKDIQLTIEFRMLSSGEVLEAEIIKKQGTAPPTIIDVAAQSLRRAALSASPLKFRPELYDKYGLGTIRLTFDPNR